VYYTENMTTTKAPREIWFTVNTKGQRQAWFFSTYSGRSHRMAMAEADLMIATGVGVRTTKPEWLG